MNSKKNVNLRITSTQYSENLKPKGEAFLRELEKEDSVEILTEGTMYRKNDARYISYEESEEAGLADTHTLVKLSDGSIQDAVASLKKFSENVEKKPEYMCIIVGHLDTVMRDPETGIFIVPATTLKP